jgi:sulfatase maturation enzyme AslB (radical SAM superfamily)
MCLRRINGGMLNPLIDLEEVNLITFKKWFPENFLKQLQQFFMCGNLGDPIIATDCLEIFRYLREVNPEINLSMHTNGSARHKEWWIELAKNKVRTVFGIDGLSDTHSKYRIDTNYEKIIENASSFIEAGGIAEWHMLVFQHNQHQIEECRNLSEKMGFEKFVTKHTTRFENLKFNVLDESGKTIDILLPTDRSKDMIEKVSTYKNTVPKQISCKAKKQKEIYISASGNIVPCCWMDMKDKLHKQDTRIDYMDKIGKFYNLNTMNIEDVFNSTYFNDIENTWKIEPLLECSRQCGDFDKLKEQFNN